MLSVCSACSWLAINTDVSVDSRKYFHQSAPSVSAAMDQAGRAVAWEAAVYM